MPKFKPMIAIEAMTLGSQATVVQIDNRQVKVEGAHCTHRHMSKTTRICTHHRCLLFIIGNHYLLPPTYLVHQPNKQTHGETSFWPKVASTVWIRGSQAPWGGPTDAQRPGLMSKRFNWLIPRGMNL